MSEVPQNLAHLDQFGTSHIGGNISGDVNHYCVRNLCDSTHCMEYQCGMGREYLHTKLTCKSYHHGISEDNE